jgi:hypothetical protein
VGGAQVVRMRLWVRRQGAKDGGGLGVRVRQCRDGPRRTGRPRAAPGLHFWHASWPGWPEPSPQGRCSIVSADPGRRTLVPCPIRPAIPRAARARRPTRAGQPPRRQGSRAAGRPGRARAVDVGAIAGDEACADGWCRPSCRCI